MQYETSNHCCRDRASDSMSGCRIVLRRVLLVNSVNRSCFPQPPELLSSFNRFLLRHELTIVAFMSSKSSLYMVMVETHWSR
jgi:hypothetical protein